MGAYFAFQRSNGQVNFATTPLYVANDAVARLSNTFCIV